MNAIYNVIEKLDDLSIKLKPVFEIIVCAGILSAFVCVSTFCVLLALN